MFYLRRMEESFYIPVTYKGKDLQFEASLQRRGYIHIIAVDVYGTMVTFERDEEGNWRGLIPPEEKENQWERRSPEQKESRQELRPPEEKESREERGKTPDVELLRTIGETIEELLK